jgi:hypothetical protein
MPAGLMNSLPDEASKSLPWVNNSRRENLGYSGTDSPETSGGVFEYSPSRGCQTGERENMWERATEAAVRVSKDFE